MTPTLQPTRALRVDFTGPAIAYLDNRQLTCTGVNVSSSGMLLFPPERARPGQFLRLIFNLPHEWIEADALLVREASEQVRYGWGVKFLQIAPHHATELQRYILERAGTGKRRPGQPPPVRTASRPVRPKRRRQETAPKFDVKDVTPFDEVELRRTENFGDDETPVRELYQEALGQLDRDPKLRDKGKRKG